VGGMPELCCQYGRAANQYFGAGNKQHQPAIQIDDVIYTDTGSGSRKGGVSALGFHARRRSPNRKCQSREIRNQASLRGAALRCQQAG